MTGGYGLLLPTRLDPPAHRGDFFVDVLEGIRVENVYQRSLRLKLIHEGTTLDEIVHALAESTQRYFPVVDATGKMLGIFSAKDVRGYLYDDTIWQIANARDVMKSDVVTVTPDEDLNSALGRFTAINVDELPVVDSTDRQKIPGILRRKEVIAAYNVRRLTHNRLRRATEEAVGL